MRNLLYLCRKGEYYDEAVALGPPFYRVPAGSLLESFALSFCITMLKSL